MNSLLVIFFISYGIYSLFNNTRFWLIYISLLGIYYYLTQVKFFRSKFDFLRRRVCIATWGTPYDPQTYSKLKLDVTKIEPYLEEKSREIGEKITLTTFCIKLASLVLKKHPEVYGYIKYGRYVPKEGVDICCLVQVGDGHELANTTVRNAETKNFLDICAELKANIEKLRNKKSKEQNLKMTFMRLFPTFLIGPISQLVAYLSSIGFEIKALGMRKNEFGSCVVTSIGSIGIEDGYAPIPPLTFAPMLIALCKKKTKYIRDPQGSIRQVSSMALNFTVDQRFMDPKTAANMHSDFKLLGENPEKFEEEMAKVLKNGSREIERSLSEKKEK